MYVYEIKKEKQHHHRKRYLKCDLKKKYNDIPNEKQEMCKERKQ